MLTWANFFTSIRVFVAPAFFYFIITGNPTHTRVALVLFGAAALTDFFDGYVARKFSEVTEFGKFLDPLADKILVLSAFFAFVFLEIIPLWLVLVIIFRDIATTLMRVYADMKSIRIKTLRSAKWKTALQMIFVVCLLILLTLARSPEIPVVAQWASSFLATSAVYWTLVLLAGFSVFTLVEYLVVNWKILLSRVG